MWVKPNWFFSGDQEDTSKIIKSIGSWFSCPVGLRVKGTYDSERTNSKRTKSNCTICTNLNSKCSCYVLYLLWLESPCGLGCNRPEHRPVQRLSAVTALWEDFSFSESSWLLSSCQGFQVPDLVQYTRNSCYKMFGFAPFFSVPRKICIFSWILYQWV